MPPLFPEKKSPVASIGRYTLAGTPKKKERKKEREPRQFGLDAREIPIDEEKREQILLARSNSSVATNSMQQQQDVERTTDTMSTYRVYFSHSVASAAMCRSP